MSKSKRIDLPQNMRVALYCRVAREDDEVIAMQQSALLDYAEKQGYKNISVYTDNGASGVNFSRPALSRLEADIQAGLVGTVIVRSLCRIGRDFIKTDDWIAGIRRKGVSFISISDGITDSSFEETRFARDEFYNTLLAYNRKNRRVTRRSG